jgi:hypothetical protein
VLVFNLSSDGKISFTLLNPLKGGEARTVKLAEPQTAENWRHEVYATMRGALIQAGLFPKEADAMLQTWWRSYFERPGLRAFWIVPDHFTSEVLPLTVQPAPRKQVRVLVGRSELLTPAFEKELVLQFAKPQENRWQSDRYFSAFAARVKTLLAKRGGGL